ncbi:MAG: efflux RND transporter periplasmic adaptor subunit [Porticoccaceae bacterium]|jgi:multidrug resistance efflux pump|nr:hypothetical protein [Porticoccaceae bacterium]
MASATPASGSTPSRPDGQLTTFSIFIELEHRIRQSADEEVLGFNAVNETRNLVPYRQAVLWRSDDGSDHGRVFAVSGLAVPDATSPFIRWVGKLCRFLSGPDHRNETKACSMASLEPDFAREWAQWLPPHVMWLPLKRPNGAFLGGLLLARDEPWKDAERHLLSYLAGSYGHAWGALRPGGFRALQGWKRRRKFWFAAAVVVTLLACLPVHQSSLAPAEIIPGDPAVVGAPIDGVVDSFAVKPNEMVHEGQELLSLDDRRLKSRLEVAEKSLEIVQAEYRQASQKAVFDHSSRVDIAILKGKMEQAKAEMEYVKELLDRIVIRAPRDGLVIFDNVNDWLGRPVATGERIMQVADPSEVKIEVWLPVAEALKLELGAPVKLFLNVAPHRAVDGRLEYASYEARPTPEGHYAYRLVATVQDNSRSLRIGLKGTAKVFGDRTLLIFHLLKRPFSSLRQYFGI